MPAGDWWGQLINEATGADPVRDRTSRQAAQQRKDFPEIVFMTIKELKRGQKFKLETPWGSLVDDVPCIDPNLGGYLKAGMTVAVRYNKVDPNVCYIRNLGPAGLTGPVEIIVPPDPPVIVGAGEWFQANKSWRQVSAGAAIDEGFYHIGSPNNENAWGTVPTNEDWEPDNQTIQERFYPFGIVRYQLGLESETEDDHDFYALGYPVRTNSSGIGYEMCMFEVGTGEVAVRESFFFEGPVDISNQNAVRSTQFFHDTNSKWNTIVTSSDVPSSNQAMSGKFSDGELIHAHTSLNKPTHNAALYSLQVDDPDNSDETVKITKSYLCLPYFQLGDTGNETVQFWEMNQGSGAWILKTEVNAVDVPDGGPSLTPDILNSGTAQTGPVAVASHQFLIPVLGGKQDILDPDSWEELYWGVHGYNPDGTVGERKIFKRLLSSNSPTIWGFQSEILAAPYPATYQWTGTDLFDVPLGYKIWQGITLMGDNPFYNRFYKVWPILMPCAGPNMTRLSSNQGFDAHLAYAASKQWPNDTTCRPGGMVVDHEETAWFVLMEPEPIRYASSQVSGLRPTGNSNEYSAVDSGNTGTVYYWTYFDNQTECDRGVSSGHGWSALTPFHPVYGSTIPLFPPDTVEVSSPCNNTDGTRFQSYAMQDKGTRPIFNYCYNYALGYLWRTKLYGLKADNSLIEIDISNTHSVSETKNFGAGRAGLEGGATSQETYNITINNVPMGDGVWQIHPFLHEDVPYMAILRDAHSDDNGDCLPAPVLQVWNLASQTKVSTVRLGSYEDIREEDFFNEENDYSYKRNDWIWNPYAYGVPRMKSCIAKGDDKNSTVLHILVEEQKVVDTDSESQYRRAVYHTIKLRDPGDPEMQSKDTWESPEVAVGEPPAEPAYPGGDPENPNYINGPLLKDWDTVMLTEDLLTWVRKSRIYEKRDF